MAGPALGSSLEPWGAGMILPNMQTGKQAPRGLWVLCKQIGTVPGFSAAGEAGELCGAGVPSRGGPAPPEPPKPFLRAAHSPDCCGATSPALRTLSQSVSSWLPRDPRAAVRPAPIAMGTASTQFFPSPCKYRARSPTSAHLGGSGPGPAGCGPMNSWAPGTLAVGRVKFFSRHRGEVRPVGSARSGSWLREVGSSECSLGFRCRMGSRFQALVPERT